MRGSWGPVEDHHKGHTSNQLQYWSVDQNIFNWSINQYCQSIDLNATTDQWIHQAILDLTTYKLYGNIYILCIPCTHTHTQGQTEAHLHVVVFDLVDVGQALSWEVVQAAWTAQTQEEAGEREREREAERQGERDRERGRERGESFRHIDVHYNVK